MRSLTGLTKLSKSPRNWNHMGDRAHCSTKTQVNHILGDNLCVNKREQTQFNSIDSFVLWFIWTVKIMATEDNLWHSADGHFACRQLFWCGSTMGAIARGWRECDIFHCWFTFHDNAVCKCVIWCNEILNFEFNLIELCWKFNHKKKNPIVP